MAGANQAPSVVYSLLSDSLELWEDDCTNGHIVLAGKYWGELKALPEVRMRRTECVSRTERVA